MRQLDTNLEPVLRNSVFADETTSALAEAKIVRRSLRRQPVYFLGNLATGPKDYVGNFGAMILSRSIDNFDDALFLLEARRYPAACAIARGLVETVAFGIYSLAKIREELTANGGRAATEVAIRHTNSSFLKSKEQTSLKKGVFALDDYQFTDQAKARMLAEAAATIRVSKALDFIFKGEREQTGAKESKVELMYDALCEWTHPSQMSLFTYYAEGAELTPTSAGPVHIRQAAKLHCAMGLKLIISVPPLMADFAQAAADVLADQRG